MHKSMEKFTNLNQQYLQHGVNFKVKATLKEHKIKEQFRVNTKFKRYYQLKSFKFATNPKIFYFYKHKWFFKNKFYIKSFQNFYFKLYSYRLSFFFKQLFKFYFKCNERVFKQRIFNKFLNFSNRFDIVCVRSMFCKNLAIARLFIKRGYFLINNKKITIWNYYLKKFDRIQLNKDCKFIFIKKDKIKYTFSKGKSLDFRSLIKFRNFMLKFRFSSYNLQRINMLLNSICFDIVYSLNILINVIMENFSKIQNIKLLKKILYITFIKLKKNINNSFDCYKYLKFAKNLNKDILRFDLFFNFIKSVFFIVFNFFNYIRYIVVFLVYSNYSKIFYNIIKNKVCKKVLINSYTSNFFNNFFFIYRYSRFYNLLKHLRLSNDLMGFCSVLGANKLDRKITINVYNFFFAHIYRQFSKYMLLTKMSKNLKRFRLLFKIYKKNSKSRLLLFNFYGKNFLYFIYIHRATVIPNNYHYKKHDKSSVKFIATAKKRGVRYFSTNIKKKKFKSNKNIFLGNVSKFKKSSNLILFDYTLFSYCFLFKRYLISDFLKMYKKVFKYKFVSKGKIFLFVNVNDISILFNFINTNKLFSFIYGKGLLFKQILRKRISIKKLNIPNNYIDIVSYFIIKYIFIKFNFFFKYVEIKKINIFQLFCLLEFFVYKFLKYLNLKILNNINILKKKEKVFLINYIKIPLFNNIYKKNFYINYLCNYKSKFFNRKTYILKNLYNIFFSSFNCNLCLYVNKKLNINFNFFIIDLNGVLYYFLISKKVYKFYIKLFYQIYINLNIISLHFKSVLFTKISYLFLYFNSFLYFFKNYILKKNKLIKYKVLNFLMFLHFNNLRIFSKNFDDLKIYFSFFFKFNNKKLLNLRKNRYFNFKLLKNFLYENKKSSKKRNVPYFFNHRFHYNVFIIENKKILYTHNLDFKLDYLFKVFKRNYIRTNINNKIYWKNLKGHHLNYYFSRNFLYFDIVLDINNKCFVYLGNANPFVNNLLMQRNLFLILMLRFYKRQSCLKKC